MAATKTFSLLLFISLLAVTAIARPCKTLFYFTATTTTTYTLPRNPNPNPNSLFQNPNHPRYFTLIFTSTTTNRLFPDRRPTVSFDSSPTFDVDQSSSASDLPLKLYSSVSSSIRDRSKDIMSVVGALLFGVGCGALTAATMYFIWSLFSPGRFDYDDVSFSSDDDDDDDDDVTATKKKLGYVAIPTKTKVVDDEFVKPALPAKEVV